MRYLSHVDEYLTLKYKYKYQVLHLCFWCGIYRLATKRTEKKETNRRKRERECFDTDNQSCTGRVTFCHPLTSWTTVTLNGHAWVDRDHAQRRITFRLLPESEAINHEIALRQHRQIFLAFFPSLSALLDAFVKGAIQILYDHHHHHYYYLQFYTIHQNLVEAI